MTTPTTALITAPLAPPPDPIHDPITAAVCARLAAIYAEGRVPSEADVRGPYSFLAVRRRLEQLAEAGRLTWQPATHGGGQVVAAVNLSALPLAGGTLADVLAPFLADPAVRPDLKRTARTLTRLVTGAPRQCTDRVLLDFAARVPATEIIALPDDVAERAKGLPRQTRNNYRSAALALRRYAAHRPLVPLHFPPTFRPGPWEEIRERFRSDVGKVNASAAGRRRELTRVREHLAAVLQGDAQRRAEDPATLTLEDVETAQRELRRTGRFGAARLVGTWMRRLGKVWAIGPYASLHADEEAAGVFLRHPEGRSTNSLAGVLALLERLGFPAAFGEAVQYHHDASRYTTAELRAERHRFPAGRIRRQVTESTYLGTLQDLRAYLGVAVNRLGWTPAEMTLEATFGPRLPAVLAELQRWWAERAAEGEVTAPTTSALSGIMRSAGTMSYVLFRRSMHLRRAAVRAASDETQRMAEEFTAKTPAEEEWYRAYGDALAMAAEVESEIANTQHGTSKTTWKDIEIVVARTPFRYWMRTLRAMQAEVRRRHDAGDRSLELHWLVQQAYKLGVQISTGMRPEEIYHVRLDKQYRPEYRQRRIIKLRPVDRKNATRHTVAVRPEYVPAWLETLWLYESRPALMGKLPGAGDAHPWLFVTGTGQPVGCPEEDAEGKGRREMAYTGRLSTQRTLWQDDVGAFAYQANGECPTERGYFTPYLIRNATAAAICTRHGLLKAAEYLGDDPSVVRDTYGFLAGTHSEVHTLADDVAEDEAAVVAPLELDA